MKWLATNCGYPIAWGLGDKCLRVLKFKTMHRDFYGHPENPALSHPKLILGWKLLLELETHWIWVNLRTHFNVCAFPPLWNNPTHIVATYEYWFLCFLYSLLILGNGNWIFLVSGFQSCGPCPLLHMHSCYHPINAYSSKLLWYTCRLHVLHRLEVPPCLIVYDYVWIYPLPPPLTLFN